MGFEQSLSPGIEHVDFATKEAAEEKRMFYCRWAEKQESV